MPLAVIAASFFLPTLKTCNRIESPVEVAADGLVWVVPWYLAALVLAIVTGVAVAKVRAPEKPGRIAGLVGVIACGLVAVAGFVTIGVQIPEEPDEPAIWFSFALLTVSLGVGCRSLWRMRTRRGWTGWTRLLLAYWAFTLPLVGLFGLEVFEGSAASIDGLGIGAYLVTLSVATLGVLLLRIEDGGPES